LFVAVECLSTVDVDPYVYRDEFERKEWYRGAEAFLLSVAVPAVDGGGLVVKCGT
jgi:hypothetical protein